MGIPTGIASVYTFDHTNLWGNFAYRNVPGFFTFAPATVVSVYPISVLTQVRPLNEFLLNLHRAFNAQAFLALIDTTPEVDGKSEHNNPDALMYKICRAVNHYGYRTSDIRAGWIEWRDVPYRSQEPSARRDSELLNQVAFNFHIRRGMGTVDNDGWVTFYYKFALDDAGRLQAAVDGWAYQYGGGEGLPDGGEDLDASLRNALPAFVAPLQSFLNALCATAGFFTSGERDSDGRPLFDAFYLLPGDGNRNFGAPNTQTGVPAPGIGPGDMPVDTEVSLALLPKSKQSAPSVPTVPRSHVTELEHALHRAGWQAKAGKDATELSGVREIDDRSFELTLTVKETVKPRSGWGTVGRGSRKHA